MYVSYDPDLGVTYVKVRSGHVKRTRSLTDLVMVDLDDEGRALGVEMLYPIVSIPEVALKELAAEYSDLEPLLTTDWRLTHA